MKFDPRSVERYYLCSDGSVYEHDPEATKERMGTLTSYVEAEDYNKLLEIHMRHVGMIVDLFRRCGEPLPAERVESLIDGTWK